ncbi:hypothetical protein Gotri_027596 [Gossypium trilobum]|uniref:Protein PHYTOCHROME KINASE SUBSTRATE 1-like n=1 Tax=Gossypium trilobum TaxID=34281 RepID=A0A7J9FN48_9ROSI|nr:hypothetical protein [Gossypium trilobum]
MDGEKRKNTSLGDVSFSSYLTTAEEIFVHNFAEPGNRIKHPQVAIGRLERNKNQVGEISVFGAENYFNMKLDDGDDDLLHPVGPRRWPGTPTASSEASWSSQSVLLPSFTGNRSVNKPKRVDGRSFFFSNLSCTGSCSDGKSVYVNQIVDHGRVHAKQVRRKLMEAKDKFDQKSVGSNREVCFRSPVLKLKTQLDDPRNSLEVFGSTAMKKGDITKNLERKLSMLTWDAIPNAPTISSVSRSSQAGDDVESDCSSDLFEIDNICGDGPAALFARPRPGHASDGMSSCMIPPYAPSGTSVDWSVVTAGAADCSFVSDYDVKKPNAVATKVAQRSRSGGILGCKSHKAVMVAETAYTRDGKTKSPSSIVPKKLFPY